MGYKSNKREALLSSYKYRIVPIPDYLCGFIQARRNEIQKQFSISYSDLNGLPLISRSKEEYRDYCTTKMLELNSKKALKEGVKNGLTKATTNAAKGAAKKAAEAAARAEAAAEEERLREAEVLAAEKAAAKAKKAAKAKDKGTQNPNIGAQ